MSWVNNIKNRFGDLASRRIDKEKDSIPDEIDNQPSLDIDASDDTNIETINKWVSEGTSVNKEAQEKFQKQNENYWAGRQIDLGKLGANDEAGIDNRVFTDIETLVGILSARVADAEIRPGQKSKESKANALLTGQLLKEDVRRAKLQKKQRIAIRMAMINRLGILMAGYDHTTKQPIIKSYRPQQVLLPRRLNEYGEPDWVIVPVRDTASNTKKALKHIEGSDTVIDEYVKGSDTKGTLITRYEIYTAEYKIIKLGDKLIQKIKSPFWDWEDEGKNHLERSRVPFFPLRFLDDGSSMYPDTDLVQQIIPLQDLINRRKRQISKNADQINGQKVGSGDYISKDLFETIDFTDPEQGIWVPEGDARAAVSQLSGQGLPATHFNDLQDSRAEIDNITGAHGVSRGESTGSETATGRQLMKESDKTRLRPWTDDIDEMSADLFNFLIQIHVVMDTEDTLLPSLGPDGAEDFVEFNSDNIEEGIEVIIRPGSTLPDDKLYQADQALSLAKMGLIDPLTLYEKLEFSNPIETYKRLVTYNTDPMALVTEMEEENNERKVVDQKAGRMQAKEDQEALMDGPVAPYQKADQAHLAEHQAWMNSEEIKQAAGQDQAFAERIADHVQAEVQIMQQGADQKAKE